MAENGTEEGSADGKVIRIGGASGALVDSATAVPQLLAVDGLDYLVFDYLAEGSMGIFARQRMADAEAGFAADFVATHLEGHFATLKEKGVRVVTNAGGLNPAGLAAEIRARAEVAGVALKVAVVDGDDVLPLAGELRREGVRDMFTGAPLPERMTSANAYLGAFPVAAALAAGADIVVTGRVVDSAIALGPLIHEFSWAEDDFDRLAAGTVIGHLLECGAQVTGGTFTDWRAVPDWAHIGFPLAECRADGSAILTKPAGTGGLVMRGTVAEQLLYEVGDPQRYVMPDVVADFSTVRIAEVGKDRVRVSGARGYPPTGTLKVAATYDEGWRSIALQPVIGLDARARAERQGQAIVRRAEDVLRMRNLPPFSALFTEIIEDGPDESGLSRVLLKIVADHPEMAGAQLFWREQNSAIMNMAVGTSITPILMAAPVYPLGRLTMFLLSKAKVQPRADGVAVPWVPEGAPAAPVFTDDMVPAHAWPPPPDDAEQEVPLIQLAWVRSGDKGDLFNVGVVARAPHYLPYLAAALTAERVAACYEGEFNDGATGRVERFLVPGFDALNFVVHEAQGGGINVSPRLDPAAKSMGQLLLARVRVKVSAAIAAEARAQKEARVQKQAQKEEENR